MKKQILVISAICTLLLAFSSCIREDYFGKSDKNFITSFTVNGQIGQTIYDSSKIYIAVDLDFDITNVFANVSISNYAAITPNPKDGQNFSKPVTYTVTSESGKAAIYTVYIYQTTPEIQLPNSDFRQWYLTTTSGKSYYQIGKNATDTIWATSNAGAVSITTPNVFPFVEASGDTIAHLTTLNAGKLAQTLGQGIAAGSLFTGIFKLNISNPVSSAKFGTPFIGKPKSFSVDYKYLPGSTMMNGKGATISGKDSLDIYLILENRSTTPWKRIATAWFRSDIQQSDFTNLKLDLTYGKIVNSKYYEVPTGNAIWGDGTEKPTHISVVFSSSARGDKFEGAPGSSLWVKNFILYY